MLVGVPKEIKVHEYRVGLTPSSVREMTAHGHAVLVQTDAGIGIGAADDDYRRAGAEIAASAEDVFRARRHDRQGQGAAGDRARDAARRPDPLHVPAPRAGSGAGGRPRPQRRDLRGLRDRHVAVRRAAAAGADVRSRRPPGRPGGRALPREVGRRNGHAARRRARRRAGPHRDPRRRRGRHQRGADGGRHRRAGRRDRQVDRGAAPHRRDVQRTRDDALLEPRQRRARSAAGRPGDLGRSDPGRRCAEARDAARCCRR